jgi:hypothetical protein
LIFDELRRTSSVLCTSLKELLAALLSDTESVDSGYMAAYKCILFNFITVANFSIGQQKDALHSLSGLECASCL